MDNQTIPEHNIQINNYDLYRKILIVLGIIVLLVLAGILGYWIGSMNSTPISF